MSYSYNRGGYHETRGQRNQRERYAGRPQKKRSGASEKICKNGSLMVAGWNYSRSKGLITVQGFTNSKSTDSESERGNQFVTMGLKVFYKNTGNSFIEWVNYNKTTGKVWLPQLGMVLSTKAANGGYLGQKTSR